MIPTTAKVPTDRKNARAILPPGSGAIPVRASWIICCCIPASFTNIATSSIATIYCCASIIAARMCFCQQGRNERFHQKLRAEQWRGKPCLPIGVAEASSLAADQRSETDGGGTKASFVPPPMEGAGGKLQPAPGKRSPFAWG